jgi:hypothetical protein
MSYYGDHRDQYEKGKLDERYCRHDYDHDRYSHNERDEAYFKGREDEHHDEERKREEREEEERQEHIHQEQLAEEQCREEAFFQQQYEQEQQEFEQEQELPF